MKLGYIYNIKIKEYDIVVYSSEIFIFFVNMLYLVWNKLKRESLFKFYMNLINNYYGI